MNKPLWLAGAAVFTILSGGTMWVGASVSTPPHVIAAPAPSRSQSSPAPNKATAPGVSHVGDMTYYTVQPFDIGKREGTLTFIAQRFDATVGDLVRWNNIRDPNRISVHQRLRVR